MISAKSNEKVKALRALAQKKCRRERGEYLVEGVKMVREAILSGQTISLIAGLPETLAMLPETAAERIAVTRAVYDSITDERTPQGVAAAVKMPVRPLAAPRGNALFLDGISDPGNLGTMIRTAVAAGFCEIYLADCADPYNPKAVRASMSGIYFAVLYEGSAEALLKTVDIPLIAADMRGEDLFSFSPPARYAVAVGNRRQGAVGRGARTRRLYRGHSHAKGSGKPERGGFRGNHDVRIIQQEVRKCPATANGQISRIKRRRRMR